MYIKHTGRQLGLQVQRYANLQMKYRKSSEHFLVPCFFHNSAYDSHMIIKHLHSKNTEKLIGFQIDAIRYLDSFKFLRCFAA